MNDQESRLHGGWRAQPERRPHIRPPRSTAEVIFSTVALVGFLALVAVTAYWWSSLPATIPTHFGIDGQPNAYGSKYTMLLLPGILLFMLVSFGVLARYPWVFNYPVTITQENAIRQYRRGRLLLTVINAVIAVIFVTIQWQTIEVARGAASSLGALFSSTSVIFFVIVFPLAMIALIVWWVMRGQ